MTEKEIESVILASSHYLFEELPQIDFGRIAAQTAKQVIVQKVREAERSRQYDEFKDRVGEIINGIVDQECLIISKNLIKKFV